MEDNGLRPRLTSAIPLQSGVTTRLIMSDAGDEILDPGVLLSALAGCRGQCSGTFWWGDGILQPGQACDDGNNVVDDGCRNDCTVEDGWACTGEPGEQSQCDNNCGDGETLPPFEQCDDWNQSNNDDCTNVCRLATCDDGLWHNEQSGEETDVDCGGSVCPGCEIDQKSELDRGCRDLHRLPRRGAWPRPGLHRDDAGLHRRGRPDLRRVRGHGCGGRRWLHGREVQLRHARGRAICVECLTNEDCESNEVCASGGVCLERDDPPVARDDEVSTEEDVTVIINVLANDTEPNVQTMTVTSLTQPSAGGTVELAGDGTVRFVPTPDLHGTVTFTYTVCDPGAQCATADVIVTVTPVNDAPVAGDDTLTTGYKQAVTIDVLANDGDVDGDTLTATRITTAPTNGTVVIEEDGRVTYTPNPTFAGVDTFVHGVCDPAGLCDTATVTIDVGGENGTPTANGDVAETDYETPVTIDVTANDVEPDGETLTVTAVTDPPNGTAAIVDGEVVYTPDAGFRGAIPLATRSAKSAGRARRRP